MSYKHTIRHATESRFWHFPEQRISGILLQIMESSPTLIDSINTGRAQESFHGAITEGNLYEFFPFMTTRRHAKKCLFAGHGGRGSWNDSHIGLRLLIPETLQLTAPKNTNSARQRRPRLIDLSPEETPQKIIDLTTTAAMICADLCIFHRLPPDSIQTQDRAFAAGKGHQGASIEQLWERLDYTLADFRQGVAAIIAERNGGEVLPKAPPKEGDYLADMTEAKFNEILAERLKVNQESVEAAVLKAMAKDNPVYKYIDDVPTWGRPAIQKMIDNGYLAGTAFEEGKRVLDVSWDFVRSAAVLFNAGVFENKSAGNAVPSCLVPAE